MDKKFMEFDDENKESDKFSFNDHLTKKSMIQSIDNKGNTFHMMKPALMMDSSTPLHVIEGSIETHSNKNGNQSVSIRYIRKPHNI